MYVPLCELLLDFRGWLFELYRWVNIFLTNYYIFSLKTAIILRIKNVKNVTKLV